MCNFDNSIRIWIQQVILMLMRIRIRNPGPNSTDEQIRVSLGVFFVYQMLKFRKPKTNFLLHGAASDMTWGGFNWRLNFRWYRVPQRELDRRNGDRSQPVRTPTMAGGLFSIDRQAFQLWVNFWARYQLLLVNNRGFNCIRNWNQHKILRFFDTLDIYDEKFLGS